MKANKFFTLIALLTLILIILIFKIDNCEYNTCCHEHTYPEECIKKAPIPNYDNIEKSLIYYKIDDNCNFQTLAFHYCFADIDPENHNGFSVLGRFNSNKLNEYSYAINTLEAKLFFFKDIIIDDDVENYKIGKISLMSSSNSNHVKFIFKLVKGESGNSELDYIYGINPNENPIVVNKNARIDFFVQDSDDGVLKAIDCLQNTGTNISGGYECTGKAMTSSGG